MTISTIGIRSIRAIATASALLLLTDCTLYPPPDGVLSQNGLEDIAQRYNIRPLDPRSKVLLVKQALEEIEKTDTLQRYRGTTYDLTYGNRLPANWILQTPNVWGKSTADLRYFPIHCVNCRADFQLPTCVAAPDCSGSHCVPLAASVTKPGERPRKFCVGHSDETIDRFYKLVVSARKAVDITMLQPAADQRFLTALRNAITWQAYSGHAVTIRVIVGDYPPLGFDAAALLSELTRDAIDVPISRIRLYVGATRSCDGSPSCGALSWNHSKIIAVDGRGAIAGGHNLWTSDYLTEAPVHDISMAVEGPAAHDAHRFADALWSSVCSQSRTDNVNAIYTFFGAMSGTAEECLKKMPLPLDEDEHEESKGGVPILAVGRLASGITPVFADQSLIARDLILGAAMSSIRMLQQDVAFTLLGKVDRAWPESALGQIADLIGNKGGDVYIILSNLGAAGPVGSYSNGVPIEDVAKKIRDVVHQRTGLDEPALSALVCQHLHLAPLRFGLDVSWPKDQPIGTHAKFWMVDERAFYIGSENLYPTDLQEFGYIVEDASAAAQIRRDYWDKAWKWSSAAAISGENAPHCIFSEK
jgi:phosphatidylserine/phosphatidylglycerophosphate/cardiolipin synthase-like enzyme